MGCLVACFRIGALSHLIVLRFMLQAKFNVTSKDDIIYQMEEILFF